MTSRAKYRGLRPVFGVEKNRTYTLEMRTYTSEHGEPYMWVRIEELPAYLMPYESIGALLTEWDFTGIAGETPYIDHIDLMDRWLDIYEPAEVKA